MVVTPGELASLGPGCGRVSFVVIAQKRHHDQHTIGIIVLRVAGAFCRSKQNLHLGSILMDYIRLSHFMDG